MLLRLLSGLVLALVLLVALGGCMSAIAGRPPHRGVMVDVGGHSLRLVCEGPDRARPTVWFEHGAFGQAEDFAVVQARLAARGVRSCAYDRAGMGLSQPGPEPRDGARILAERDALIGRAAIPGPFVVVAHSFGGIHARLWAASRPGEVVGLVLVDASPPEALNTPGARVWVRRFGQFASVATGAARLGLLKPLGAVAGDQIGLPAADAAVKRHAFGSVAHNRWSAAEIALAGASAEAAVAAGKLPADMPVAVVSAGPIGEGDWDRLKASSAQPPDSLEAVEGASHASVLGERYADAVVRATLRVLAASSPVAGTSSP